MTGVPAPEAPLVVLVVEDEPALRQVVAITLRREGMTILEAGDGAGALVILQSGTHVDALLTDVKMPGLNGYQLAEASLALRPEMPVILMTGYADETVPEKLREATVPVIRKPFNFTTLGSSIKTIAAARK
jgi:DNA-binding NtrC family response regulator